MQNKHRYRFKSWYLQSAFKPINDMGKKKTIYLSVICLILSIGTSKLHCDTVKMPFAFLYDTELFSSVNQEMQHLSDRYFGINISACSNKGRILCKHKKHIFIGIFMPLSGEPQFETRFYKERKNNSCFTIWITAEWNFNSQVKLENIFSCKIWLQRGVFKCPLHQWLLVSLPWRGQH